LANQKITQLTELTAPITTDMLAIVDDPGGSPVTKKVQAGSLFTDGWVNDGTVWTYVSASTFSIPGNVTATYQKGTFLKWTQTTVKYGVVVSSSYSAPNTTVTIVVNTDYTIANAAISANYFSYAANPRGWPGWFAYTPTFAGFSAAPTVVAKFNIVNKVCHVLIYTSAPGTSNATNFTITMPVVSSITSTISVGDLVDNSAAVASGLAQIPAASSTLTLLKSAAGTWTNANNKYASFGIFYAI